MLSICVASAPTAVWCRSYTLATTHVSLLFSSSALSNPLQMGEMHVHLGDVCAHMDRDEESEEHYRTAQAKVLEAKALWPQAVTDELVQTMEELVNGGGDDDDEVEEEEEEEEEEN